MRIMRSLFFLFLSISTIFASAFMLSPSSRASTFFMIFLARGSSLEAAKAADHSIQITASAAVIIQKDPKRCRLPANCTIMCSPFVFILFPSINDFFPKKSRREKTMSGKTIEPFWGQQGLREFGEKPKFETQQDFQHTYRLSIIVYHFPIGKR